MSIYSNKLHLTNYNLQRHNDPLDNYIRWLCYCCMHGHIYIERKIKLHTCDLVSYADYYYD